MKAAPARCAAIACAFAASTGFAQVHGPVGAIRERAPAGVSATVGGPARARNATARTSFPIVPLGALKANPSGTALRIASPISPRAAPQALDASPPRQSKPVAHESKPAVHGGRGQQPSPPEKARATARGGTDLGR